MKCLPCRCFAWLAVFTILVFLLGCESRKPIPIGFIGGLSGRGADLGVPGRNGVMLAIEQINKAGGFRGRAVELIVRDDRQDSETAKTAVSELLAMGTKVIIGPMTSSIAMAVVPLVDASSAILVSPTVSTTDLSGKDDHFLRVCSTTRDYATKSARYQYQKLRHRRAVAIYDLENKAYAESWLRDFADTFIAMGGSILKTHTFRSSENPAFFSAVQDLLSLESDVLLVITNAVDAALICHQVRKISKTMPIAMAEWASTERLIELGGIAVEGVHVFLGLDRMDASEKYQSFHRDYMERFGQEPGFSGLGGFNAALVVLEALTLQEHGKTLKQAIIGKGQFNGVQQTIKLNRFGDAERRIFIGVIAKGKYRTIE